MRGDDRAQWQYRLPEDGDRRAIVLRGYALRWQAAHGTTHVLPPAGAAAIGETRRVLSDDGHVAFPDATPPRRPLPRIGASGPGDAVASAAVQRPSGHRDLSVQQWAAPQDAATAAAVVAGLRRLRLGR